KHYANHWGSYPRHEATHSCPAEFPWRTSTHPKGVELWNTSDCEQPRGFVGICLIRVDVNVAHVLRQKLDQVIPLGLGEGARASNPSDLGQPRECHQASSQQLCASQTRAVDADLILRVALTDCLESILDTLKILRNNAGYISGRGVVINRKVNGRIVRLADVI